MNIGVFLILITLVISGITCLFIKALRGYEKLCAIVLGVLVLNATISLITAGFVRYAEPMEFMEIYTVKDGVEDIDFRRNIVAIDSDGAEVTLDSTWVKVEPLPEGVVEKVVASWGFLKREMYIIK